MNLTRLIRPQMLARSRRATLAALDAGASQHATLMRLLAENRRTWVGRHYGFDSITNADEFRERLPIVTYEDIRPQVMRMVDGERDVLCPGRVRRYAQSSGTSGGKSKYIPLPDRSLARCHYAGSRAVVSYYLRNNPDSRLFAGRAFILGGSFANELHLRHDVRVGDLSAHLIDRIPAIGAMFRTPSKSTALMADWQQKLPRLVSESVRHDITNISGVPSWFMTVLRGVLEYTGADTLHDVWPGLEVFFHGGIAFGPYREQYLAMVDPSRMRFMETYNASEGFFALCDDPSLSSMLLLMDNDVFYEFMPLGGIGDPHARTLTATEVRQGGVYALIITSSNGLWRYMIGDTVRVDTVNPLRITIAGRTQAFINAFGEEVMVYNTDAAITEVAGRMGVDVLNYTAGPVYADGGHRGRHRWLIEFGDRCPDDIGAFATALDVALQGQNSDYQAKRAGDIFLDRLEVIPLPAGSFDRWLATTGKLGGQRKVPRLANDSHIVDALLGMTDR